MAASEQAGRHLRLRDSSLEWRQIEGEIVALDLQASVYLRANSWGAVSWDALAQGATEEELVERLSDRYRLARAKAVADVRAFVAALQSSRRSLRDQLGTARRHGAQPAPRCPGGRGVDLAAGRRSPVHPPQGHVHCHVATRTERRDPTATSICW